MGLFCQTIHAFKKEAIEIKDALVSTLSSLGYRLTSESAINEKNKKNILDTAKPASYAIGPCKGNWITIIDFRAEPWTGDVTARLSEEIKGAVFSMMVHDDDVMFYNLEDSGRPIDGYNSNLQYFEEERLPDTEVKSQRHTPEMLGYLLPSGKKIEDLQKILNKDWWDAFNKGELDEDGVMTEEAYDNAKYVFEGDRMKDIGTFLELAGRGQDFPYSNWRSNSEIDWNSFAFFQFEKMKIDKKSINSD